MNAGKTKMSPLVWVWVWVDRGWYFKFIQKARLKVIFQTDFHLHVFQTNETHLTCVEFSELCNKANCIWFGYICIIYIPK